MKYLKILGLAAVAAMALTALFGAGSASASGKLCNTVNCTSVLVNGSHVTATLIDPPARLTASPEVQCNNSSVTVKVTNSFNGTGEVVATNGLKFNECKTGNTPCTVTANGLPWDVTADKTSGGNGTLTVIGGEAFVKCQGYLECTFGNNLFSLPIVGSNLPTVTANAVVLNKVSGFICPSFAKWDATYQSSTPVFIG